MQQVVTASPETTTETTIMTSVVVAGAVDRLVSLPIQAVPFEPTESLEYQTCERKIQ